MARPTIRSGKLRHMVQIQQITTGKGSSGGATEVASTFANVWASIEPMSGREFFAAAQRHAEATHVITIRYLADIVPKMRIVFGTRSFDIISALNDDELGKRLSLVCTERLNG